MTIVSRSTVEHYRGDGVQTQWPVGFPFFRPEHVRAGLSADEGELGLLEQGRDYVVRRDEGVGGIVECSVPEGQRLTIWLDQPFTQDMDLRNTGVLDAEVLEQACDRLTLMAQQLRDELARCIKVGIHADVNPEGLLQKLDASVSASMTGSMAAETARAGAEVARAGAEAARAGAEVAKSGAETARDEAGAKRGEIAAFVEQAKSEVLGIAAGVPIGMEATFPVNSIPAGWLVEMGQTVTRAAFPELVRYLTGSDTAETATLPDMRGMFARGADLGRGIDPGRVVGSEQGCAVGAHQHGVDVVILGFAGGSANQYVVKDANTQPGVVSTRSFGSDETRPRNVAKVWCIKAYHAQAYTPPTDITAVMGRLDALAAVMNPHVGKFNVYAIRRAAGEQVATAGVETNILTEASASGALNVIPDAGDVGWTINEGGTYRINARVMVRPAASTGYTTIQVTCWRRRSGNVVALGTTLLTSGDASLWNNIPFDLPLELVAGDTVYFTIRSTGNNTIIYNSAGHASITRLR